MKKTYFLLSFPALIILFVLVAYNSGSPGGKTGSPGDGGATCVQCHAGTVNQSTDWISTNVPLTGYVPGNTYTITLTGTHTGVVKFGFEVTAEDASGNKVGTFIITDPVQTQLRNGTTAATHTSNGNTPSGNSKTWVVDWTAPAAGTGDIGFYAAFNAANGNGTTSGDVVYNTSTFVSEASNPEITGIVPDHANQGESFSATISGSGTSWTGSPAVTLSFSGNPGEVIPATNVIAVNNTTITADFSIPTDASTGLWDVNVDALSLDDGFTVNETIPSIVSMIPAFAYPGDVFTANITGENTSWLGTTPVVYLAYHENPAEVINGTNVVVISDTELEADFDIPQAASIGNYDIHVDDLLKENGFTLLELPSSLTSIDPDSGKQGETILTTITGENTSFASGVTDVFLSLNTNPTEIITATSFTISSDTVLEANFDIPNNASPGLWDVNVDGLSLENGFTVIEVIMSLTTIVPDSATQGDILTATITAYNTSFTGTSPNVFLSYSENSSEIISASSVNVLNDTMLEANLNIPTEASVGLWDVNVDMLVLDDGFEVHLLTGLSEFSFAELKVYPNPTNGLINLKISENADVELWDISGNHMSTFRLHEGNNNINLDSYSSGIYFLNIIGESNIKQMKIVVK